MSNQSQSKPANYTTIAGEDPGEERTGAQQQSSLAHMASGASYTQCINAPRLKENKLMSGDTTYHDNAYHIVLWCLSTEE